MTHEQYKKAIIDNIPYDIIWNIPLSLRERALINTAQTYEEILQVLLPAVDAELSETPELFWQFKE